MSGNVVAKVEKNAVQLVEGARADIAAVLPAHVDVEKVVRGVRLALAQKPELRNCDPKSVLFAVMHLARLGLEPNTPLRLASLVAYGKDCVPLIEFRGYQDLARRSGLYTHIDAVNVYAADDFAWQRGTNPSIHHVPNTTVAHTDADIVYTYAIAWPKEGPAQFDVLSREEVERARGASRMKNGDTWSKWWGEMARKTAVRRLAKYLSLSPELAAAIELDTRAETGEVSVPSVLLDDEQTLSAHTQAQTAAKMDALKRRMKKPEPEPEPEPPDNIDVETGEVIPLTPPLAVMPVASGPITPEQASAVWQAMDAAKLNFSTRSKICQTVGTDTVAHIPADRLDDVMAMIQDIAAGDIAK